MVTIRSDADNDCGLMTNSHDAFTAAFQHDLKWRFAPGVTIEASGLSTLDNWPRRNIKE